MSRRGSPDGYGWTLIQSWGTGTRSFVELGSGVTPGSNAVLAFAQVRAIATNSTAVRIAERGTTEFVQSRDDFAITKLREGKLLNDLARPSNPEIHWTGNAVARLGFDALQVCNFADLGYPSLYWACNTEDLHILSQCGQGVAFQPIDSPPCGPGVATVGVARWANYDSFGREGLDVWVR